MQAIVSHQKVLDSIRVALTTFGVCPWPQKIDAEVRPVVLVADRQ
jgi:hypothetical protein